MSDDVVEILLQPATLVEVVSGAAPVVEIIASGDVFRYVHTQLAASDTWVVLHNLGGYPSVTAVDSAGTKVFGDVSYDTAEQVTLTFAMPFGGKAYFS